MTFPTCYLRPTGMLYVVFVLAGLGCGSAKQSKTAVEDAADTDVLPNGADADAHDVSVLDTVDIKSNVFDDVLSVDTGTFPADTNSSDEQDNLPKKEKCCDGIDNDGNGLVDFADPVCKTRGLCPIKECRNVLSCAADFGCQGMETKGEPYLEIECLWKCFEDAECTKECTGLVYGDELQIWNDLMQCDQRHCAQLGGKSKAACYLNHCFPEFLRCTKRSTWSECVDEYHLIDLKPTTSCGESTYNCWEDCQCGANERCLYNCLSPICMGEVDPFLVWHTCRVENCLPPNNTVGTQCHLVAGYTTCLTEASKCVLKGMCNETCKNTTDCMIQCVAQGQCEYCLHQCAYQRCNTNDASMKVLWQCLLGACTDDLTAACLENARTTVCASENLGCE